MSDHTEQIDHTVLLDKGLPEEAVLSRLHERLAGDLRFGSGRILGSMCSEPDSFASRIFAEQLEKNIGDPGLHPSLAQMEKETVRILGNMLGSDRSAGALVSGGTEANILAMWTAKLQAPPEKRTVVLPESAHFSFDKAASLMDITLRKIPVDRNHQFSLDELTRAINDDTMALVGIAGTTGLGIVDPIPEMAHIAVEHSLYFHVDAAFGGFVLPFLEEAGFPSKPFDFAIPGVCSITIDPHKMGRAPIPSGAILYRNEEIAGWSKTDVDYLSGGKTSQQTIVGTRSGAAVAAVWGTLRTYGRDGYAETVRSCMETTDHLCGRIRQTEGIELVTEPFMNVVGFRPEESRKKRRTSGTDKTTKTLSTEGLAIELRRRGFAVSLFPGFIRITVMPHVTKEGIDRFWKEVEDVLS